METQVKNLYASKQKLDWNLFDGLIFGLPKGSSLNKLKVILPEPLCGKIIRFLKVRKFKFKVGEKLSFDLNSKQRVSVFVSAANPSAFAALEQARAILTPYKELKSKHVLVDVSGVGLLEKRFLDAFVSAAVALSYVAPKYETLKTGVGKKKTPTKTPLALSVRCAGSQMNALKKLASESENSAHKTNLVRNLSQRAGNDLTTTQYVKVAKDLAGAAGLETEFFSLAKLGTLKAGAFLAVAQGSDDKNGGILKLSYRAKNSKRHIALVGKGITFDTGGNNIKTGGHMYGMNGDMGGSAVALAVCLLAAQEQWPFNVDAYLAITDNIVSAKAYRPNDVVTSLKGKTIEVIDTDAEGRMILADTLTLASREKPDLVIDFATLTGSVIRAIGTNYSGGYSNRWHLLALIRRAGKASGERVWPFPKDADYGRCLKSDIADLKQCRHTGGVDHIEASYFLSQFVEKDVPWVHIDLAAMDADEGLAHVPTKPTGFGVRFARELIFSFRG